MDIEAVIVFYQLAQELLSPGYVQGFSWLQSTIRGGGIYNFKTFRTIRFLIFLLFLRLLKA